jgi:hypothetical protein
LNEHINNAVEGINQSSSKTASMSAKPNQQMHVSENAMLNHSSFHSQDFQRDLGQDLIAMPLYVKGGFGHEVAILTELWKVAHPMIIGQFQCKCHT